MRVAWTAALSATCQLQFSVKVQRQSCEVVELFASTRLEEGQVYTRADLREKFGTSDATINNGVFRPQGLDSIWLFVTENKGVNQTQYQDLLTGDVLHWDGQLSGRTDKWIIDHHNDGVELLVFYRKSKAEFPGSGFRYLGRFRYMSSTGSHPTHFLLRRTSQE
jgi:5-methylcytosine-specific restriction protein A